MPYLCYTEKLREKLNRGYEFKKEIKEYREIADIPKANEIMSE